MSSLEDKVGIVTGASKGLGKAIANRLAQEGAIVVASARSEAELNELANKHPGHIYAFPCDVTEPTQVKALVQFTVERFGRIDFLVNNAGIGKFGSVEQLSVEDWDQMMAVNAKGPFLTSKFSIPYLKKTEGHIVNISSIAGTEAFATGSGYCASKFALMALTDALTLELKPYHVKVTAICPGSIKTEFQPPKDYAMDPEQVADTVFTVLSAPKNVIYNQVIMRPLVPRDYQK